jgi:acyl carrier protein
MLDQITYTSTDRLMRLVEELLVGKTVMRGISASESLTEIGLTSIDMVNLMLAVEAEFDIMIPQSDITPENFRSISSIEALVAKLG